MRLPKSSLVAAACLLAATTTFAYQNVQVLDPTETVTAINGGGTLSNSIGDPGKINNVLYNPAGGSLIQVTPGLTLTINSEYATTLEAIFQELGTTDTANMVTDVNGIVSKTDGVGNLTGGNVTKVGGGVLQINSGTAISGGVRFGFVGPTSFESTNYFKQGAFFIAGAGSTGQTPLDLGPQITGDPDGRNAFRVNGLQGTFTVDQGTVRLAGFINMWHDFGAGDVTVIPGLPPIPPPVAFETADNAAAAAPPFIPPSPALARRMTGVREVVVNGSSVIEFTNSPLNTPNKASTSLAEGSALRLNFLHNLHAGVDNDQFRTEIIAGTTDDYRVVLHIDQGVEGSAGILSGAGSYIKSGAGSLIILNESRFTGDFTAAGGLTILDSAGGLALASAASVSLAGIQDTKDREGDTTSESAVGYSRRGQNVRYLQAKVDVNGDNILDTIYKEAYSPDPGTHTLTQSGGVWTETSTGASLEIRQDQTIRNFQSNFALKAAPLVTTTIDGVVRGTAASAIQNAADNIGKGEPVIAGTGVGSSIELGGHTLNIIQEAGRDGIYEGSIVSAVNFAATVTATGGLPAAPTYRVAFDVIPDTGVFRLNVTDADGINSLTDSIRVGSAAELQSALASAFGLADSAITVVADTSGVHGALAYDVTLATAATINSADNLATGKVVFNGASSTSKLALNLLLNGYAETEIAQGSLVANAEALGTSRVNITGGELEIFQKQAGTLSASLIGSGTVRVVASSLIDNGSGTAIEINSTGGIGTLNFGLQQRRFTGNLIVNDGVNVSLSANTGTLNDTLLNANSITLDGAAGGVGSVLSFNNTNQVVRNLSGDALSRIDLGRGTMTLDVTSAHTFLGGISGVGSVIKTGAANFNITGNGQDDYTGATIVQKGSLSLGSADAIRKSSAIVLASGTSISAGGRNQTIGALFGETGSTLSLGASTLTVGFTPARYTELGGLIASGAIDLLNLDVWTTLPLNHNYLGTTDALQSYIMPVIETEVGSIFFDRTPLGLDVATEEDFTINNDPATGWPVLGMVDQTKRYLAQVAYLFDGNVDGVKDGVISQAEIDRATASADTLAFAGVISGTGAAQNVRFGVTNINPLVSISKTGIETLTLSGANTFTGAVVVRQGTLQVEAGSLATGVSVYVLANSATIDLNGDGVIDATALDDGLGGTVSGFDLNRDGFFDDNDRLFDGALAVNVTSGSANWTNTILGDGNFVKTGAGTLVLNPLAAQHTGTTTVAEGTLDLTLLETTTGSGIATLGDVNVATGATLVLRTPANFTTASSISYVAANGVTGEDVGGTIGGSFTKSGLGVLSIAGSRLNVGETVRVQQGVLSVDTLPNTGAFATLSIDSGAEFRLTLAAADNVQLEADLTGAGTFNRLGTGYLLLSQLPDPAPAAAGAGFTGTLRLAGGTTELDLPGSLPNAKVQLIASTTVGDTTTLVLGPGAFAFASLSGDTGTEFALDPLTVLTLNANAGSTDVFSGHFTGGGDLVKTGTGVLSLDPGVLVNALGDVTVSAGTLRATVNGIGTATSIDVLLGATLEFNAAVGEDLVYTAAITGAGSVAKIGAGRVSLTGNAALPSGTISVNAGTLAIQDTRVGSVVPAANIAADAILEILLTGNRNLGAQVTGDGNLRFNGAFGVTLQTTPSFGGYIALVNGADLAFDPALTAIGLGGLAADAGSDITINAGQTLTLTQTATTDFNGQFLGGGELVIKQTGTTEKVFRYLANGGDLSSFTGVVTVNGGALQVSDDNLKSITLTNGGSLHIFVDDPAINPQTYGGSVDIASGTSNLVKVGTGTLDLTGGLPTITGAGTFGGLVVREGRVLVGVSGGSLIGGGQVSLADTGSIAVSIGLGDTQTLTQVVATDGTAGGTFEKLGLGKLILQSGTTSAAVLVTEGILQLGLAGAPASLGSDVTIATGATLTGTATIAGDLNITGTVSPGYSPGTLIVDGDLDFAAGSVYDAEIDGGNADLIRFNGALTVDDDATLRITGSSPIGTRHTLLSGGSIVGTDQFAGAGRRLMFNTGPGAPVAYIVDTQAGGSGRLDVIIVRASSTNLADPAASLVTSPLQGIDPEFVANLNRLARVNLDLLTGEVEEAAPDGADLDLDPDALSPLGRQLAALSYAEAPAAIKSLTGIAYLSGLGMAHLSASADNEALARRTEQRRFDRGYMSVKKRQFYFNVTSGSWDSDNSPSSPGYDISRQGMMAGWDSDLTTSAFAGVAVSIDTSKAKLASGGTVEATQARVHAYTSVLFEDEATYLEGGAYLGQSRMDANRGALAVGASASPTAFTGGAWIRLGTVALLGSRTSLAPFVQFDLSHAAIGGFTEAGPDATRLKVEDISQTDLRGRLGVSLAHAWDSDSGDWRYRFSFDLAYVGALSGESVTTRATNDTIGVEPDGAVIASADPLDRGGLMVTPAFTFGPDHDTSYGVSAELRRLDGGDAASINLSYRRRF